MKPDEINHETIFKLMVQFLKITKKFNELEKKSIDVGIGEKLYPSEFHVIVAVGSGYENTVTGLSKRLEITKGAVSQVVNKLNEKGFLNKERNKDYGKEIILSLTEKGQNAFKVQDDFHKKMEDEFISHLETVTPEQMNSFIQILDKIEDYVDIFLRKE
ncbi:MarR family winged helix-turn-helix transcriptional regulator [Methanobacterium sp.]|uniref:MarR family winged helix-turn-helix transcriptional regulator n=1 Tax=Methanobacterium sp. TaxID=2164 RepID=UPI003C770794